MTHYELLGCTVYVKVDINEHKRYISRRSSVFQNPLPAVYVKSRTWYHSLLDQLQSNGPVDVFHTIMQQDRGKWTKSGKLQYTISFYSLLCMDEISQCKLEKKTR